MYKYICIRATCMRIFCTRFLITCVCVCMYIYLYIYMYIHIYGTLAGIVSTTTTQVNDEREKKENGDMYALELSCYE